MLDFLGSVKVHQNKSLCHLKVNRNKHARDVFCAHNLGIYVQQQPCVLPPPLYCSCLTPDQPSTAKKKKTVLTGLCISALVPIENEPRLKITLLALDVLVWPRPATIRSDTSALIHPFGPLHVSPETYLSW